MSNQDWLSLTEIARRWSNETGASAEALERDLDAWFADFVARDPSQQQISTDRNVNTTNRLMGLLGGRYFQREIFAVYCEEKGLAKPDFWFAAGSEDRRPCAPLPSDSTIAAANQALIQWAREPVPERHLYEGAWTEQTAHHAEPTRPAPRNGQEAPSPAAHWPAESETAAAPDLASIIEARPNPNPVWQTAGDAPPDATVRRVTAAGARRQARRVSPVRKAARVMGRFTGGFALGLALVAGGFVFGQGGIGHADSRPDLAGWDEAPTALVSSLKSELAGAWRQIAELGTAPEASEGDVERKTASLSEEAAVFPSDATKQTLVQAAASASAQAVAYKAALEDARLRITELEATLQILEVKAGRPAKAPEQPRQAQDAALGGGHVDTGRATDAGAQRTPSLLPPRPKPARSFDLAEGKVDRQVAAQESSVRSSTADVTNVPVSARGAEVHAAATRREPNVAAQAIDVDSLVADPSRFDARQVVVTGTLRRLVEHYRLQSKSSQDTLVVDLEGIHRTQFDILQDAIVGAGMLGSVRAQISGKVVRGSAKAFHLVASDLVLVE